MLPLNIQASVDALRADRRVLQLTLDAKLAEIETHLVGATVHGTARAEDIGAELRAAAQLLRRVPEIESLLFPTDDPPDISLRFQKHEVTIEVIRLAVQANGPNSDTAFVAAEGFSADLLAACSEERPDWYVWRQVREKLRRTARRGRSANVLLAVSDSPTVKWTLPGVVGAWRAVVGATIDDEPVPFGDVVVWYDGPILNEGLRRIGANRVHQTPAARALIEKAFPNIGAHYLGGPGDDEWDREKARREMYYMWEFEDRGRRRRPDAVK
jgi:hypothetical protein